MDELLCLCLLWSNFLYMHRVLLVKEVCIFCCLGAWLLLVSREGPEEVLDKLYSVKLSFPAPPPTTAAITRPPPPRPIIPPTTLQFRRFHYCFGQMFLSCWTAVSFTGAAWVFTYLSFRSCAWFIIARHFSVRQWMCSLLNDVIISNLLYHLSEWGYEDGA